MNEALDRGIHRVGMNGCRLKVKPANRMIGKQQHDGELVRLPVWIRVNDEELTGVLFTCNFDRQLEAVAIHVTGHSPCRWSITEHERLTGCDERIHG